jgi:BRCT domain type II-containing protein
MATEHLDLWEALIGSRKNALRQASMVGWDTFFQVATRSITLEDLVEKVCRRIGVEGRVIVWEQAEPCMDVDKPHQLELLREDLAKQQRKSDARTKASAKKITRKPAKPAAKPVKKTASPAKKTSTTTARTKAKAGK